MKYEIEFYETASGNQPVEKFIRSLEREDKAKILFTLKYIQSEEIIPSSILKKMVGTPDLWEIRIKGKGGIFRLLCFFDGDRIIVALSGFQKKTEKTPKLHIQTAINRKKDYLRQQRGKWWNP